jgi:hypothetical protein
MKKLLLVLAVFLLVSLVFPQPAAGKTSSLFEATLTGDFGITGDVGGSPLFIVEESGTGNEKILGAFTFESYLTHNLARVPPGCGPNSSTGVGGSSVLTFVDGSGQLKLKRISGTACFSFPFVTAEEEWVISSGTGNYVGASGKLSRQYVADVRSWIAVGPLSGTIKLP